MNSVYPNFYQVCRLCLSKLNGSYIPLFGDNKINSENVNYCVKIKFCFSITVEEADDLPNALCNTCMKDVDKFYNFKETVVRNNAVLKAYTCNHMHKNGERPCKEKNNRRKLFNAQKEKEKITSYRISNFDADSVYQKEPTPDNDPIDRFLHSAKDKITIEMIPQVYDSSFDSSQIIGDNFEICVTDNNSISNNDDNIVVKSELENDVPYYPTQLDLSNKTRKSSVSENGLDYSKSNDKKLSPIYNMISRTRIDSSSLECLGLTVPASSNNMENCADVDSEDTKSVASEMYKEEIEDIVIDEECEIKSELNDHADIKPDSCILLRTLTDSSVHGSSYSTNNGCLSEENITRKLSSDCSSPSSIKNELDQSSFTGIITSSKQQSSSSPSNNHLTSPQRHSSPNQGSTRRKQKCPTKSIDGLADDDEENIDSGDISESRSIQQQIINISPVTVREEVVSFSQTQFLDEVLSRHSSPATTPPIIPLYAERLHKACDVLLRAASKIHELPMIIEEGSNAGNNSSPSMQQEDREIDNALLLTRKMKNKDKLQQNMMTPRKECSNCHAIQTTIWRRDRFGNIVCNACGLYYKLHNFDRPCRMRRDEIHKRNRKRNPTEKGKKNKRNANASLELMMREEMEDQDLSQHSYSDSRYDDVISVADVYALANGMPRKRRSANGGAANVKRTSPTLSTIKEEDADVVIVRSLYNQQSQLESSPSTVDIEFIDTTNQLRAHDVQKPLNDLYTRDELKMITSFQISARHFLPINATANAASCSSSTAADIAFDHDTDDDSTVSEAPLNLAASGH